MRNCNFCHQVLRLLLAATFLLAIASGNAQAQTLTTMVDNGAASNRVDMIFIGDGYLASQLDVEYADQINLTLDHFFNNQQDPFPRYNSFFNVHRVNIASNQQGADKPLDNVFVDTALDASYSWGGNVERCLYFNTGLANAAVGTALAGTDIDVDMRIGMVNDAKYGGCGGQWAVLAGANGAAPEIALHEVGHSFGRLADEYYTNGTTYTGNEPSSVNLTTSSTTGKWDRWLDYVDPDNTDLGAIGYFEGGGYNENGLFRPSNNSKMRSLNRAFDAISREQFINQIYAEVDPVDDWLDNSSVLDSPSTLWLDVIDEDVINVEWFVDGVSYGLGGETLDIDSLGLSVGDHTIEAMAYDGILDHSFSGGALDWWRYADDSALRQSISWNITVSVPEPGSAAIIGCCFVAFGLRRRR